MVDNKLIRIYNKDIERLDIVKELLLERHPDLKKLTITKAFIINQLIDFLLDNAKMLK